MIPGLHKPAKRDERKSIEREVFRCIQILLSVAVHALNKELKRLSFMADGLKKTVMGPFGGKPRLE